jgi:predicted Zn-dependent peptidase
MEKINLRLDELYATPCNIRNSSTGAAQCLGFSAELLGQRFLLDDTPLTEEVLSVILQMLCHPIKQADGGFCDRYVEAEKKNISDSVRALANRPSSYALSRFYDIFNEQYEHGHLLCGSIDEIAAITQEQLSSVHERLLCHTPIYFFYVGDEDPHALAALLAAALRREMPARFEWDAALPKVQSFALPILTSQPLRRVDEELSVGQSHLIMGYRTGITLGSSEFYAMMLCNEILGASPVSRLFRTVREEKSLCYSCSSEYAIDRGDVIISCGIDKSHREEAEQAILEQVALMRAGDFSDAEMEAARKLLLATYTQLTDGTKAIAGFYITRHLLGIDQTIDGCRRAFAEVTREQIVAAARKMTLDTVYFLRGTGALQEGEEDDDEEE